MCSSVKAFCVSSVFRTHKGRFGQYYQRSLALPSETFEQLHFFKKLMEFVFCVYGFQKITSHQKFPTHKSAFFSGFCYALRLQALVVRWTKSRRDYPTQQPGLMPVK